jgi:hypothetical protein
MKPIPPERREAILARLSGPAREPVARVAAQEGTANLAELMAVPHSGDYRQEPFWSLPMTAIVLLKTSR